ncbi:uncharacterized protein LOC122108527 [Dipodomys spectabilis]|uniref:uncharacterized protein LOC122108527 n=1 Tax=Dipodomys spectabilis TaxID=105255 RepID=UPI001C53F246|nr:uncharacterized protein LOC122108527 [Dipodomys spectabilis]
MCDYVRKMYSLGFQGFLSSDLSEVESQKHTECFHRAFRQDGLETGMLALEMKQGRLELAALVCTYITWALGIILAISRHWRIWEFDAKEVQIVFIGLWKVYYYQKVNGTESLIGVTMHTGSNESWIIPPEIQYGRDLILLANFMKSVVLIFSTEAILVSWIKAPYPDFLRSHYNISVLFLLLSSFCTLTAVFWNHIVDFYGQTTFQFRSTFPVQKEELYMKHFSYVLPLGIFTVTLSVSTAAMFIYEICALREMAQMSQALVKFKP